MTTLTDELARNAGGAIAGAEADDDMQVDTSAAGAQDSRRLVQSEARMRHSRTKAELERKRIDGSSV